MNISLNEITSQGPCLCVIHPSDAGVMIDEKIADAGSFCTHNYLMRLTGSMSDFWPVTW